jgi:thiol:disulfide interchange protein DsbD
MRRFEMIVAGVLAFVGTSSGASWDDLLSPERAFPVVASRVDDRYVRLAFDIADGYAMYRGKFKFVGVAGFEVTKVELPDGERVVDPYLGEIELYRGYIEVTVIGHAVRSAEIQLEVTSQGCADVGVCFNPTTRRVTAT